MGIMETRSGQNLVYWMLSSRRCLIVVSGGIPQPPFPELELKGPFYQ